MSKKIFFGSIMAIFALNLAFTANIVLAEDVATSSATTRASTSSKQNMEFKKVEEMRKLGGLKKLASTTRDLDEQDRGGGKMNASTTRALINSVCAKVAIDIRKPALSSAYDAFFVSVKTALLTREDAVKSSFDKTTERDRVLSRVNARNTYRKSVKSATEILRRSEKAIMNTYSSSIKNCSKTI